MLFDAQHGKSLVTEAFNQMCVDHQVECSIQPLANPGNPFRAMRMLKFRNFSNDTVRVFQFDSKKQIHEIPAQGSVELMLGPDEPLPILEKVE